MSNNSLGNIEIYKLNNKSRVVEYQADILYCFINYKIQGTSRE